jgi:ParB family chromosome partitioning protein
LLRRDERADLGFVVRRVADDDRLRRGDEAGDEFIVRLALDEDAAARAAILAGVGEDAHRRLRRRFLQVGVGEDDVGRLAAQLEADPFDVARGELHDPRADLCRSRERDFSHQRMRDERFAHFAPRARQHLEHARGQAGFVGKLRETKCAQRRGLGGLEDDRVAGGERGGELPAGDRERKIPRHDRGDDSKRLAEREVEPAGRNRDRVTEEFADGAGVVLEDARRQGDFIARVGNRFADALQVKLRELLGVVADGFRDREEDFGAAAGLHVAPGLVERALRPADGDIGVVRRRAGEFVPRLLGRRVGDVDVPAAAAAEIAVDKR